MEAASNGSARRSRKVEEVTFVHPLDAAASSSSPSTATAPDRPSKRSRRTEADSRGARTRQSDEAEAESSRREAFVKARRDVLELGAATFEGRDRRVWEGKRLASLGATAALLKPKHKMPLKMLFGVQSKQRHLEKFRLGRERESGVVSGRSATGKLVHGARKSKAEAMAQRRRKTGRLGGVSSLDDDGMRGGVLRVGGIRGGRGRGRGRGRGKA